MGLINGLVGGQSDVPGAASGGAPAGQGSDEGFTPEQEASLEKFSLACKQALFADGGMADKLSAELAKPEEDSQTLANFSYQLTAMLDAKSRGMLDVEALPAAAADVLDQVIEVAQAAGAKIGPKEVARATQLMLNKYLEENGASRDDLQKMNEAADAGKVGEAIDKRDNIGGAPAEPPTPAPAPGIVGSKMEA